MSKSLGGTLARDLTHFQPEGNCMELAKHIKEHRARLGMSQEELAESIFVSRQTISNWETDRTYPDVHSLLLLSNLFNVSIDSLVKGDVEEMKAVLGIEAKRLNTLGVVMAAFGVAAIAWVLITLLLDQSMATIVIPAILLWVPAMVAAVKAERIKRDNQLYTYQAVDAFMRGGDPDVLSERNQQAGRMWWGKVVARTLIALPIGFCCGWGLCSIVARILGL